MSELIRCELHCHSNYSKDSDLSLESIIATCKAKDIKVIALTDHNEIQGAFELQKIAPDWLTVIPAEEIATKQGDVIGLFLREKITARLDIHETIRQIHDQGGVVLLPHPFDRIRKEAVGLKVTESVKDTIDFIEVFNARCVFAGDNAKAKKFAELHNIPGFVGSDAHTTGEYGNASCYIKPFSTPEEFVTNLKEAKLTHKPANKWVHITTKMVKIKKKRSRL
jgi:predicted metal-dependent phosphoesterase TrpH